MRDDDSCGNDHRRRSRASLVRHYSHDYYEACGEARARHQITMWRGVLVTCDQSVQSTIAGPVAGQAALHGMLPKVLDLGLRCSRSPRRAQSRSQRATEERDDFPPVRRGRSIVAF